MEMVLGPYRENRTSVAGKEKATRSIPHTSHSAHVFRLTDATHLESENAKDPFRKRVGVNGENSMQPLGANS